MDGYLKVPNFNPILIDLPGPLAVSWYGLMYLFGFLFTYFFVKWHIKNRKIVMTADDFSNILVLLFLGVLIGGRLGFCLFVEPAYYLRNPLKIIAVWDGGMYFFGGLLGAMILPWFSIRKTSLHYLDVTDLLFIPAPIALAFGRIGNFINGEFWGKPSTAPWAMIFDSVPPSERFSPTDPLLTNYAEEFSRSGLVNLPRHPVQLYELIFEGIVLFLILLLFRRWGKAKPRASIASLFLFSYGLMRFFIEFYRHPSSHSAIILGDWFTLSMLFSLPMIILGAVGFYYSYKYGAINEIYGDPSTKKSVSKKKKSR